MSTPTDKSDEVRNLKRALIDHMVTTMVAGMMSGFLFLVWNLYSTLEKRMTEQEKETTAALLVLKESAINYKVRLDMLEREPRKEQQVVVAQPAPAVSAPAPVATSVPPATRVEPSFWTPAPPRTNRPPDFQQQVQQQQSFPPSTHMRQAVTSLAEVEAARDELRKKISEAKPGAKP